MSDEVETNILYLGQPGDAGRKRMSEILERLDDLWEKASDVDSLTVLDAREEIVKLRAEAKDAADEIEKLRAALQTARRDAREQVARYHDLMAKMAGSLTELQRRSSWVHNESAKAIRSGIDIRVLGEKE
jgi:uncharacterized coiled-coil DUF342 family protein